MEKDFPDWNKLYNTQNVETMPWYNENLDSDLEEELEVEKFQKARFLTWVLDPQLRQNSLQKED